MKYKIDAFILDTQARTLSEQDNCQKIRPKTLALLLYLMARADEIISKQTLLDHVWDDVSVDEGVIFQSVREVRKLFANANIIQNFPRKGYQFTAIAEPLLAQPPVTPAKLPLAPLSGDSFYKKIRQRLITRSMLDDSKNKKSTLFKYSLAAMLMISLVTVLLVASPELNENIEYDYSIVVLPVKNHVPYAENDWVYLGAMEQLIGKLKGLPNAVFVYQGTYIPHLMQVAGLTREFDSTDVTKIFNASGAKLIVETELLGNVSDYKLVYKFHVENDVKQGVILDKSINDALTTLAEKLAAFIQHPLQRTKDVPVNEFSDALFAQAMISYESDWQTSISFFESYLALNHDSVTARIYLSKLYLWRNEVSKAGTLMDDALVLAKGEPLELAHVYLIKGRVAAKEKQWQVAMQHYAQAEATLGQHRDWFLKGSIAEEQGLALVEQGLLNESAQAFTNALSYYQIIQSPIGTFSTQLHLANVLFQQGQRQQAQQLYLQAKENIGQYQLEFLYSMLEKYQPLFAESLTVTESE